MLPNTLVLAALSSLVTLLYLHFGVRVLRLAPRSRLNQVFSGVCLVFAFWSFSYTLLPTSSEEHVWFWFKLSSPGWTLGPSLLLHFFVLLAGREAWLERKWVLPAIYVPGLLFLGKAWMGPGHMGVDRFVQTAWGWSGLYGNLTLSFVLFLLFLSGFICFGLAIVYRAGRKAELLWRRRQAELVVFTGLVVLPLVSFSGIFLPWLGIRQVPEVAHLLVAAWILAVRFAMSRYQLMVLTPAIAAQDILRTIQDSIILLDQDRKLANLNEAGEALLEAKEADLVGLTIEAVLDRGESATASAIGKVLDSGSTGPFEFSLPSRHGQPTPLSTTCSEIRDEHGQRVGTLLILRDITHEKRAEEELRFTATHDPLTGLPNRSLFQDRLLQAIERADRTERPFAVLLADLDKFKDINDSYGHDVGDAVLQEVARRLQHAIRGVDTVSRFAGDEFLLILEDMDRPTDVDLVIRRIMQALGRPISVREHTILCTASIGVSLFPTDTESPEVLLQKADLALYSCKRHGSGLFEFFSPEMEEANRKRIAIERGLQHALANDELMLLYQPMVDLTCQRLEGVEALLRWRSSELGLLGPVEFIPVAEDTGLILPIGEWVLRTACSQCQRWQVEGEPPLPISVNVSIKQLRQEDFVELVANVLETTGLDPSLLEIELTESVALGKSKVAETAVLRLGDLGVRIVIDDFGTGHSSLARLRQLQMHALKIDRAFIQNITSEERDRDLVATILAMAHRLKVGVTAEGVETREQLGVLQAIAGASFHESDLNRLQGFLFSKPVPPDVITSLLQTQQERLQDGGSGSPSSRIA